MNTEKEQPFFAKFLEGQFPKVKTKIKAGHVTHKFPSDDDEDVTMKYPSDDDEGGDRV